jgi:hypothetical protein
MLKFFTVLEKKVHYGLYIEWTVATGGLHVVPMAAKRAWIALIVIFWVLYLAGLALVPRQFTQERNARHGGGGVSTKSDDDEMGLHDHSNNVVSNPNPSRQSQ